MNIATIRRSAAIGVLLAALVCAPAAARTTSTAQIVIAADRQLSFINADGSHPRSIGAVHSHLGLSSQAWSSRARVLYVSHEDDLAPRPWQFRIASATGRRDVVVRDLVLSPYQEIEAPAWSPDGRRVAFALRGCDLVALLMIGCVWYSDIFVMHADGHSLLPQPLALEGSDPVWSPDSHRLAFTSALGVSTFDVDRPDPPRPVHPATTSGRLPAWSPDGRRIAFVDGYESGPIWVARADGSTAKRLRAATGERPAWSPDGRLIAYADSRLRERNGIAIIRPNGTGNRRITREPRDEVFDGAPQWAGSSRIVYIHEVSRRDSVMAVDVRHPFRPRKIAQTNDEFATFAVGR